MNPVRPWQHRIVAVCTLLLLVACGAPVEPGGNGRPSGSAAAGLLGGAVIAGEGATYVYDAAGNLLQIGASAPSTVSIAGFTPAKGGPGQLVTIFGAGFSPTPSDNAVLFGGVAATVLAAVPSELTVVVPAGAATGPIRVTSGGSEATSAVSFIVDTAIQILDFSPRMGRAGDWLSIDGLNFAQSPASNTVQVGGGASAVQSASLTWLGATLGSGVSAGKVTVTTPSGSASSTDDFFLLPAGVEEWEVGATLRVAQGASESTRIELAGQVALVLFDGVAGQNVTLHVSGVTLPRTTEITVIGPARTTLTTTWVNSTKDFKIALPKLPTTGVYIILIRPELASAGGLDLQVLPEATADLLPSVANTMAIRQGQNGRATFSGTAGQSLTLALSGLTVAPAGSSLSLTVLVPSGGSYFLILPGLSTPGAWRLPNLPETGTYTIWARPSDTASASFTLLLTTPDVSAIAIDGPAVEFQNALPGQATRYLFAAVAGQQVGLGVAAFSLSAGGGALTCKVLGPDGAPLWSGTTYRPYSWQLPAFTQSGTYTLEVTPPGTATATASLLLSSPVTGAVAVDGSPTTIQTSRIAQAGRYAFSGVQGRRYTLRVTAGANTGSFSLLIYPPASSTVFYLSVPSGSDTKLTLGALADTGVYRVNLDPGDIGSGQVTLQLLEYASDTLVVDGPPKVLAVGAAQNGRYTFTGTAGDLLGVGVSAISTVPAGATVPFRILRPDGASLWASSTAAPYSWQLAALPSTGIYTMEVTPPGVTSAAYTVLLTRWLTGILPTDGTTAVYDGTRVGQFGTYTFSGTAGQRFSLQATAGSVTGSIGVYVYQPSGALVGSTALSGGGDNKVDLGALPATGTYVVKVEPFGAAIGRVSLRLVAGATGSFVIDDPPTAFALGAAQNGRFTFTGSAGDLLGLGLQSVSTTPANTTLGFRVLKPDGVELWNGSASATNSWQLPALPTAGTYTLELKPPGTTAASFSVLLSRPIAGTLVPDAAATVFGGTRLGQAGRYTFTGVAGGRYTLRTAGTGLTGYTWVYVYQPSGATLTSIRLTTSNDVKLDLGALPVAGNYLVTVVPVSAAIGQVSLRLIRGATGTLTVNGPATPVTLVAAQDGRYTFSATTGLTLKLVLTALVTTPAGRQLTFTLFRPDGTAHWGGITTVNGTLLPPKLTTTGTYTLAIQPYATSAATFNLQLTGI